MCLSRKTVQTVRLDLIWQRIQLHNRHPRHPLGCSAAAAALLLRLGGFNGIL